MASESDETGHPKTNLEGPAGVGCTVSTNAAHAPCGLPGPGCGRDPPIPPSLVAASASVASVDETFALPLMLGQDP
jgi:hypothetical protein